MSERLLEVEDLSVAFQGPLATAVVVDRISFTIGRGERYALVGESGSGKSVTAQALMRLQPDATVTGSIRFGDLDVTTASSSRLRELRGRRIAMIFQEPMSALNPLYPVGDQISEVLVVHRAERRQSARRKAVSLLERCGITEPERRYDSFPHQLSGGQRQRAMIAMALACDPELIIADEPTTALDVTVQARIMALLRELQDERGMAILLITHDLPLVRSFAQRIGVMHRGRIVESGAIDDVFERPQADYTRRLLASRLGRMVDEAPAAAASAAAASPGTAQTALAPTLSAPPPIVRVAELQCTFGRSRWWSSRTAFVAVDKVSFEWPAGQTLGVVGESGSGKTTLAMAILRLSSAHCHGRIELSGSRIDDRDRASLRPIRRQMQMVFQDPFNALSPRMTVGAIVGEGLALHRPELDAGARLRAVHRALSEVGLETPMANRYPHEFSGGQRQRIAIARALVLEPQLLILDEPTSALDATVQRQVLELIVGLQRRRGLSYMLITHDLDVVRAIAHRVVVLKDGRVVEAGPVAQILEAPTHAYTRSLLGAVRALQAGSH
jgi:microcin C transport system ATP-binding protein